LHTTTEAQIGRYRQMLRIRTVEETIARRYGEGEMRCPVHLSIGQEASAVGACAPLSDQDRLFSTHRSHAHYLAKGGDLYRMLAEIYGKADGCIGGRGGSMHLMDDAVGMMASVPIVGSDVPLAVGSALAAVQQASDVVSVAFAGDASVEEGVFHESANFAALRRLPVIFVCEDNGYSVYTPVAQRQPRRPLTDIALAHGIPGVATDGNNVNEVADAMTAAVDRAREGGGPTMLVLNTFRWLEHCGPADDDHLGYRDPADVAAWRERDPIALERRRLLDAGLLDDARHAELVAHIGAEVDDAFTRAEAAPLPVPADAGTFVYA
jgi:TPP-dependent pyruvate/acetoin dehydrogenase alpha subunit